MSGLILLLPGNMCDARLWHPVQRQLDTAGFEAVIGDLSTQDTISGMAGDMLASRDGPLIPIGFSMGAIVALEMARQAPGRIERLGLVAINASADLPDRAAVRPRQQAAVQAGALEAIVAEELKPNYLAAAHGNDLALRQLLMDMAISLGPDVFVRQSEALRTRADLRAVLPALRVPVLLACGAEDRLCPPEWHRRWADAIGSAAELKVIPEAGHMLPLEEPERLAEALIRWLQSERQRICPTAS